MSAIHDLISQVTDPRLRDRLAAEWAKASKEKKFGLVRIPLIADTHSRLIADSVPGDHGQAGGDA